MKRSVVSIQTGVLGDVVDYHFPIPPPKQVLLQPVCDDKVIFPDVYSGKPGSIYDSTSFKESDLYSRIRNKEVSFSTEFYLIDDLAYPFFKISW